jgi:hypothetical protein
MYLESIEIGGEDGICSLNFGNASDGRKMNVEIPQSIGFDLKMLLDQKLEGIQPYSGVTRLISQIGGKISKLIVRGKQKPGTVNVQLEILDKFVEIELFLVDAVSIAIINDMPIYFDESICIRADIPFDRKLFYVRTSSITNYSFDAS